MRLANLSGAPTSAMKTCYERSSTTLKPFSFLSTTHLWNISVYLWNSLVRTSARGLALFYLQRRRRRSHVATIRFEDAVVYLLLGWNGSRDRGHGFVGNDIVIA